MPDRRFEEVELDRFLNDLVQGGAAVDGYDFDPDALNVVRQTHALATEPMPFRAHDRLGKTVQAEMSRLTAEAHHTHFTPEELLVTSRIEKNSHVASRQAPVTANIWSQQRGRWTAVQFVTAAVVLLTIIASYLIFGSSLRNGEDAAAPAVAPGTVTGPVQFVWQANESPDEFRLAEPYHLAIDAHGNVWTPDGLNNRFHIFTPQGTLRHAWGNRGGDAGEFDFRNIGIYLADGAGAAVFDLAGNLYVLDPGNYRVQKFGPDLSFITSWGSKGHEDGQFVGMNDLTVDAEGRVYVLDAAREDVQVFDSEGTFLTKWGKKGVGEGEFLTPFGITIDHEGNIVVVDTGNHRLQRFSPDGSFQAAWGSMGTKPGQFRNPDDIAIDTQGRMFVTDWANNRVQVLDAHGQFLTAWGERGSEPGQLMAPTGITLDKAGNVYVAEVGNKRIQKFRLLPPLAP